MIQSPWDFLKARPETIAPFQNFDIYHITAMAVTFALAIGIPLMLRHSKLRVLREPFRYLLFTTALFFEIMYRLWFIVLMPGNLAHHLGLHLCGFAIFITLIVLLTKNEKLYEVSYFWGLGAGPQAIVTPALGIWGFPHYHFFHIFASHGLLLCNVLFLTLVDGLRPRRGALLRIIIYTNVLMLVMAFFNYFFNTNYLYICYKPPNTLMDFLGPWPWYILGLEAIGIIMFALLYVPILIERRSSRKKEADAG